MSSENDSPERIAADILIALMGAGTSTQQKDIGTPDAACDAYKKLFKAVHQARNSDFED